MSGDASPEMLRRREILRRAAWLLGGAVSAPAALAILQGCSAKQDDPTAVPLLAFLSPDQFAVIGEIAEIMIPKTATSGAKDVGVAAFIDTVLGAVYDQESQERFNAGYTEFMGNPQLYTPFLAMKAEQRALVVKDALEAALAAPRRPKPFILVVRELTLLGYFSSKLGITENFEYVPVPTAYHGCVPVSQMKKTHWE